MRRIPRRTRRMPMPLRDEQQKAVKQAGSVIVSASAGTGKTTTLVGKIAHLVREQGCDIGRILAVTFTKKAAAEMKERLARELGSSPIPPLATGGVKGGATA